MVIFNSAVRCRFSLYLLGLLAFDVALKPPEPALARGAAPSVAAANEARTAARLDAIVDSPPRLRMFLQAMPKGGDLHNHGAGANYAEDFLIWAAADGLCIATDTNHIVDPPCDAPNRVPAAGLERDYDRYTKVIDALSTRGFESGVGDPQVSGYDRFFATFEAFSPAHRRNAAKADVLAKEQAAADRVPYVELSSGGRGGAMLGKQLAGMDGTDFAGMLAKIAPLLPDAIKAVRADYDRLEAEMAAIEDCKGAKPSPACGVEMRYQYTAFRTAPPQAVFAQMAFGFALVEADPRFVGVNIAAPEHDPVAVRDYALHMRMFAFLKKLHSRVPLTLHAGELAMGLVPPRELKFHIHDAVVVAGARRIGHGVAIAYETDAPALLARMARDRVAVEINLTSNAVILGVKGKDHPLSLYREAGVPVVLSTDDEGVSRSDMTNEYQRAVSEQGLRYRDLKQIARDGLQYSFMPGASLWQDRAGGAKVAACRVMASAGCAAFVAGSVKARVQAQLEQDFAAFEAGSH